MTDKELSAICERVEKATPGPWEAGLLGGDPLEDFRQALAKGVDPEVHLAFLRLDGDPEPRYVAITGNGPTSEENADFIAHARADVPYLLDEVERLRGWAEHAIGLYREAEQRRIGAEMLLVGERHTKERELSAHVQELRAWLSVPLAAPEATP